jgi:hypothetical protein
MTVDGLILNIDVSDLEEVTDDLDAYPMFVNQELTVAMEASLQLAEGQIAARTPVNFGPLRSSIDYSIISPFPNLVGRIGSPLPYAIVMEEGRRPGARMPPVDAIKLWVVRKLKVPPQEADSVAFLVARSIARKGIEGRHMFAEGLEAAEPHIRQLFNNAIERATRRFNQS